MANTNFLVNTRLSAFRPILIGGAPVTGAETFRRLKEAATRTKVSPVKLLAEPALGSESEGRFRDATWFSAFPGEAKRLTSLTGPQRAAAEMALRQSLAGVKPLLDDADVGPLLGRALLIPTLDDVYVVDGNPALVNWGFVPEDVGDDDDALAAHFAATLGPFADYTRPWAMAAGRGAAPAAQARTAATVSAAPAAAAVASAAGRAPLVAASVPWYRTSGFIALWVSLLVGAGVLIGWWLHPQPAVVGLPPGTDARAAQSGMNDSLRTEIDRLRGMLEGNVCSVDAVDYTEPLLRSPGGALPGGPPAASGADPSAPADPAADSAVPPDPAALGQSDQPAKAASGRATIRDALEQSVVAVLVSHGQAGSGLGSGFFVTPDTIMTNRHVVGDGVPEAVYVVSKTLGRVLPATLVTTSPGNEVGQRDYAVLKVAQPVGHSLPLAPNVEKLARIYVGGFPAFFVENDPNWERLLGGDASAAPDMAMAIGDVILLQQPRGQIPQVIHTADVRQGNSGGPLLDSCGRVVGINTFINMDAASNRTASYSIASSDIAAFLREQSVAFEQNQSPCEGEVR